MIRVALTIMSALLVVELAPATASAQVPSRAQGATTQRDATSPQDPDDPNSPEAQEQARRARQAASPTKERDDTSDRPRITWDAGNRITRDQLSATSGFGARINPRIQSRLATRIDNRLDRRSRAGGEALRGFDDATNNTRTNPR